MKRIFICFQLFALVFLESNSLPLSCYKGSRRLKRARCFIFIKVTDNVTKLEFVHLLQRVLRQTIRFIILCIFQYIQGISRPLRKFKFRIFPAKAALTADAGPLRLNRCFNYIFSARKTTDFVVPVRKC